MLTPVKKRVDPLCFLLGLIFLLGACFFVARHTGTDFLSHSAYDSYTLQALAWREGRFSFADNYPWLELAVYNDQYFVSFPPVPSIPMLLLSFIFGEYTPSSLCALLYFLGGYAAAFCLARRYLPAAHAMILSVFLSLAGSLLDITVSGERTAGAVWYQAQLLGYLLALLSFLCMDGYRRGKWALGLVFIALAVGCRPLNAVYVPLLLWMLHRKLPGKTFWRRVRAMLPYVLLPGLIACAYGLYNYARFGNPLEFGHSFLPEYTESGDSIFSLDFFLRNVEYILRPPSIRRGVLWFPITSGFGVYLTNPLIFYALFRFLRKAARKEAEGTDVFLLISILLHACLLLTHRTNGGWQYGTRYLCDVLPACLLLFAYGRKRWLHTAELLPMSALVLFNVYGSIVFHTAL